MIEIGKNYRITMIELSDRGYGTNYTTVKVTGRDGYLLEVDGCEVINMASPLFHSLVDEAGKQAYFKKVTDDFLKNLDKDDAELS